MININNKIASRCFFVFSVIVPSLWTIQKFFGIEGVAVYSVVVSSFFYYIFFKNKEQIVVNSSIITMGKQRAIMFYTLLFILIFFLLLNPYIDLHSSGLGSDGDDALNQAVFYIIKGKYPYKDLTYLGNPITPLPGAILFSFPFVLLGNSGYQNFFWLGIFFLVLQKQFDLKILSLFFISIFILSPGILHSILIGSDYVTNSLIVLISFFLINRNIQMGSQNNSKIIFPIVLFGVALSWRANFLFILPLFFVYLKRHYSILKVLMIFSLLLSVFTLVTLPFYLIEPNNFTPFHSTYKLSQFNSVVPDYDYFIVISVIILSLFLSKIQSGSFYSFLRNCSYVLIFPVITGILLSSLKMRSVDFSYSGYGILFIFFSMVGFGERLFNANFKTE